MLQPDVVEGDADVRLAELPQIESAEEASQEIIEPAQEVEGKHICRCISWVYVLV